MMRTLAGFIIGLTSAAVVTVLYGEQLSSSLQVAIDSNPQVSAVLDDHRSGTSINTVRTLVANTGAALNAAPEDTTGASTGESSTSAPAQQLQGEAAASDAAPDKQTADEVQAEQPPEINLQQRWSDYAARAPQISAAADFPWHSCFTRAAAAHDVPETLLLAIASGESNFDPAARSSKDAVGLMQIRWPGTSRHLGIHREADLYDPCTNVNAGARYIQELLKRYDGNLHLAIAAYNYGPSRIAVDQVPDGANWYSHYIFQHLQAVLGEPASPTSELIPRPQSKDAGVEILMSFSQPHRAREFIAYLTREVPGLELQQQREQLGQHRVVLLYSNQAQRRTALQAIHQAGVATLAPLNQDNLYL